MGQWAQCRGHFSKNAILVIWITLFPFLASLVLAGPSQAAPGDLDTSFGANGIVTTPIGGSNDNGRAVALLPDGRIVVAGYSFNGVNDDFAVARYNSDGSLDTSFDGDGIVTTPIGADTDQAMSVAIQSDGRIVAAGHTFNGVNDDFAVVRYNGDGSLDTSFDGDGIVTTPIGTGDDLGVSVAIQSDGRIVVAGHRTSGAGWDIAVVRYNTNGSLDTSFDSDGIVVTPVGTGNDFGDSVALQSDGRIVVGGNSFNGSNDDFAVVRYNTDGSLDTTFGTNGITTTPVGSENDRGSSIAIQPDGRIVLAGNSFNGSNTDFALARFNSDGSLDTSFGSNGTITTAIGSDNDDANAVAIQPNGRIVATGSYWNGTNRDIAVVRYNNDGSLDGSFGTNGMVTTGIGSSDEFGDGLALQPDGRIVVAGNTFNGTDDDFAVVRYQGGDYTLSVGKDGSGTGTVTSSPAGIDCGDDCSEQINNGTRVTLTAVPDAGHGFQGWTGADCPGNYTCIVTMDRDYSITATFNPDDDGDGIPTTVEDGGPNGGDGNGDGTKDSLQDDVTTFTNVNAKYVTLVAGSGTGFKEVNAQVNPSPDDSPANVTFPEGFYGFKNIGVASGGAAEVDLILHESSGTFNNYFKYGPTSDNTANHWYKFNYGGGTGAEWGDVGGKTLIKLHFQDGGTGDGDLTADGTIVDPSGPGNEGAIGGGGGGGGGGCFLAESVLP